MEGISKVSEEKLERTREVIEPIYKGDLLVQKKNLESRLKEVNDLLKEFDKKGE